MRIPADAVTLCNIGDGHLVDIMAYFFQCTQTTKWKPSNLALPEWEVQQFDHAQKEPHDKVAPLLFVKVRSTHVGTSHAIRQWTTILQQLHEDEAQMLIVQLLSDGCCVLL